MAEKKTVLGMGGLVVIGLLVWAATKAKPALAAPPEKAPSKWELIEMTVPITRELKKEIPIFPEEA